MTPPPITETPPKSPLMKLPTQQRRALHYIGHHQTDEYGAIVLVPVGNGLLRRGLAECAPRRSYARATGLCLRLSAAGLAYVKEYE